MGHKSLWWLQRLECPQLSLRVPCATRGNRGEEGGAGGLTSQLAEGQGTSTSAFDCSPCPLTPPWNQGAEPGGARCWASTQTGHSKDRSLGFCEECSPPKVTDMKTEAPTSTMTCPRHRWGCLCLERCSPLHTCCLGGPGHQQGSSNLVFCRDQGGYPKGPHPLWPEQTPKVPAHRESQWGRRHQLAPRAWGADRAKPTQQVGRELGGPRSIPAPHPQNEGDLIPGPEDSLG